MRIWLYFNSFESTKIQWRKHKYFSENLAIFKLADIIQVFSEHFYLNVYVVLPILFVAACGMKDIQSFIRYTSSDHFCEQFAFVYKNIVFIWKLYSWNIIQESGTFPQSSNKTTIFVRSDTERTIKTNFRFFFYI